MIPEKIYPVNYAGFWDFSEDGYYGDSVIHEMDCKEAPQIAEAMAFRYNNFLYLVSALNRCANCSDLATAREYAREALEKIIASNKKGEAKEEKENG